MRFSLICLFCFTALNPSAQEYTFQDEWLDHSAKLSNQNVLQVIQDFRRYIWVATADGLNRFDGTGVRTFYEDGSRNGMPSNCVYALHEYRPGRLLVGTSNGICILNTVTGEFEPNPMTLPELKSRSGKRICSFFRDSRNRIWVSHQDGYDILDTNLVHIMRISDQPWARDLQGSHVFYAGWKEDSQGRVWLPTDDAGVIVVDERNRLVRSWKTHGSEAPYFQRVAIRSFWLDEARHEAWFGSWGNGLVRHNFAVNNTKQELFGLTKYGEQSTVNHITPLSDSLLLCYTGSGPFLVNRFTMAANRPPAWLVNSRRKYTIRHRMQGRLGNIWEWGSEGLYQISRVRTSARISSMLAGKSQGAFNMLLSGNQLYLAYYKDGLVKLDLDRKVFQDIPVPGRSLYSINNLALGPDGGILASSEGIYRVDTLRKTFTPLMQGSPAFMQMQISDMHAGPDGTVWWSTLDTPLLGAYRIREGRHEFLQVALPVVGDDSAEFSRGVEGITHDREGNLWMREKWSTRILCFNPTRRQWKIYRPPLDRVGLGYLPELSSLHAGTDGVLWFCSVTGGGLIRYDTRNGNIVHIRRKQGISSDIIYDICPDNQGNLFLKTSNGIDLFDMSRQSVVGFLPWTLQLPLAAAGKVMFDSSHQTLLVGMSIGVVYLPRRLWLEKPKVPTVYMDRVMVSNQSIPFPAENKPLMLQPGNNSLSLVFSAVNFRAGSELLFSYMLDRRDRDWSAPSPSRNANYTELPPGTYRFRVRAVTSTGRMGEITEFPIVILPYFWQTAWFWMLALGALAAMAWWYFRSRINTLKQEAALQRRMAETEMDLLRSQINPHFIFNCLSAIDNLIQTHQVDRATTYLARFARMLRSVIESTRYDLIPIQKDIENIRNYILLEQFMSNGKFEFRIDADPALAGSDLKVPPMIIQPFVENAIRHGLLNKLKGDRFLLIRIELDHDLLRYTVTDNGVGRKAAMDINQINKREHQSFGVQITADRIRLLNRHRETSGFSFHDLSDGDKAAGTRVEVWIDTTPV